MEYEHTPRQMAEKLMEFNRDFSDNEDDVKSETEYLIKLFDELQNSEQFNVRLIRSNISWEDWRDTDVKCN